MFEYGGAATLLSSGLVSIIVVVVLAGLLVVLWRSNSASKASSRSWFASHHSHSCVLFRAESRLHFVYNKISVVSVGEGTQQQQQ